MTKILVVDDEPELRFLARVMLERAGYEVVEAKDGAEALERLEEHRVSLVLLDVMMPGDDGWVVCRKIKERHPVPVVMFTVRTSDRDRKKSQECGADAHVNKPFDREELLRIVRRMLEGQG